MLIDLLIGGRENGINFSAKQVLKSISHAREWAKLMLIVSIRKLKSSSEDPGNETISHRLTEWLLKGHSQVKRGFIWIAR